MHHSTLMHQHRGWQRGGRACTLADHMMGRGVLVGVRAFTRDALEGKGAQRRPQRRLDRRLEEVAKRLGAVTVGYKCH